jgi:hypothetical protein
MSEQGEWWPAWPSVRTQWDDCTIGFDCACGNKDLSVDSQGDEQRCSQCGRTYRLRVLFEVREPAKEERGA